MVKSLVAVEISHYTSDTGHPLYGLLVPYPRSGFTITAVTFNLRFTAQLSATGCLFACTPDADSSMRKRLCAETPSVSHNE